MDDAKPLIEERENGPLAVKHVTSMVGSDGTAVETKDLMVLCRCGRSQTKPFCDGTHNEAGFLSRSDKEPSGKDKSRSYRGREQVVYWNSQICSHAENCIVTAPTAFDPDKRPWIAPDEAAEEQVAAAVRACPSGALRIETRDGPRQLLPDRAQITVEKDGPYWVQGPQMDVDLPGEGGTTEKFALCRCGLSGNKPYCDGSHNDAGWTEDNS